ncbi:MAG: LysM peptidoglycan-binding domain-containing protein [Caldilineales bacterium]
MVSRTRLKLILMAVLLVALLVPVMPAAAAPDYQGGVHIVQRGENLSMIAQRYGVSPAALAQANGISNPNLIYTGQRLVIPGAGGGNSSGGGGAASGGIHIVQRGENLSSIAQRYGTSTAALARANSISNPNHIYVGQRLVLTSSGGAKRAALMPAPPRPATRWSRTPAAWRARWIDINLSTQSLTAYEGNTPVFNTLVSTGSTFPTPVGTYHIQYKVRSQRMTGPGYDLPNVPWVMYFTNRGHAIHGAYWHNNFGHPMSHGCVNMRPSEAEWLYNFTPNGATVVVHR